MPWGEIAIAALITTATVVVVITVKAIMRFFEIHDKVVGRYEEDH